MEDQAELIRDEMRDTREGLGDKLEALEEKVTGDLGAAQESVAESVHAVTDTVEHVTEGLQHTAESLKEALDVSRHVRDYPWLMMGGAAFVGFMAGSLLVPSRRSSWSRGGRSTTGSTVAGTLSSAAGSVSSAVGSLMPTGLFGQSWENLQRTAARTALDLVGRAARENLPGDFGKSVGQAVDQMSAELQDGQPKQHQDASS
jgi:ElaB/YqjD/DUF883 family membrane-anchored ribosome-binding protein